MINISAAKLQKKKCPNFQFIHLSKTYSKFDQEYKIDKIKLYIIYHLNKW